MKNLFFAFFAIFVFSSSSNAQFYSDVQFIGDVTTGNYAAVSGLALSYTNTGYFTNIAVAQTNYYRVSATNFAGRIPLSSNIVAIFTPHATLTNAVVLSWTRPGGIARQVIEKSYDAGTTWTNWLTLAPTLATWTDTGSNSWTGTNIFTNVCAAIPAGVYPWATHENITDLSNTLSTITNAFVVYRAGLAYASYPDWASASAVVAAGDVVHIMPGSYTADFTTYPLPNRVDVIGAGRQACELTIPASCFLAGQTNRIQGLRITSDVNTFVVSTDAELHMTDVYITNSAGYSVYCNATTARLFATSCDFAGAVTKHGIAVYFSVSSWHSTFSTLSAHSTNVYDVVDAARLARISGPLSWSLFPGKNGTLTVLDTAGVTNQLVLTNGVVGAWSTNGVEVP